MKEHNNIGDFMDLTSAPSIIIKGFISIFYLFAVIKLLGKKQISELNIFDYVIGITLGNIAAEMTVNKDITIINGIVAMSVYAIMSLFISYITAKSILARRFVVGFPIVLMENGKISKEQLKKVKIDVNDLLQDARENGYFDLSEIEYAVMEVSGKVSFLPKGKYKEVTCDDMKIKKDYSGLVANLVMDGKIMSEHLKVIGHDEKWLRNKLKKEGYEKIEDLFLVLCDSKDKLTVYPMNVNFKESVLE